MRPAGRLGAPVRGAGLPSFVVVGAMRSGSTALARYLGEHPDVFMAWEKEVRFFTSEHHRGLDWYRSRFSGAGQSLAVGEATPSYLHDPRAVDRMADTIPEARLIAILRHPVDRAYSHYWLNRARGTEPLGFAEAIQAEPERLARGETRYAYLEAGRYGSHLRRLAGRFPRHAIHVALFEDLRRDPGAVFAAACRFLGVDDAFRPANLGRPINRFVAFRWPALRRAASRWPGPLRRLAGRINRRESSYPPLDPSVRADLVERFTEEVGAVEAWVGRELPEWRR